MTINISGIPITEADFNKADLNGDGKVSEDEYAPYASLFGNASYSSIANLDGQAEISWVDITKLANLDGLGTDISASDLALLKNLQQPLPGSTPNPNPTSSINTYIGADGRVHSIDNNQKMQADFSIYENVYWAVEGIAQSAARDLTNKYMQWNLSECGLSKEDKAKVIEILNSGTYQSGAVGGGTVVDGIVDANGKFLVHGSGYSFADKIAGLLSKYPDLSAKVMPFVEKHEKQISEVSAAYQMLKQELGILAGGNYYYQISVDSKVWEDFKEIARTYYNAMPEFYKKFVNPGDWLQASSETQGTAEVILDYSKLTTLNITKNDWDANPLTANNSWGVTFEDIAILAGASDIITLEDLKKIDTDGDGKITVEEIKKAKSLKP